MTCLNSNTINVLTTIEGAGIGDDVVATSRHNAAVTDGGRLVDVRIGGLILEKSDPVRRIVFPHDDWFFTVAPPAPFVFEAEVVACPVCTQKAEAAYGRRPATGDLSDAGIAYSELHEQLKAVATRFRLDRTVEPERIVDSLAERIRVLIVQREQREAEVADQKHALALEVDRTNDANQRADQLAARIQELEVEAARFEHVIEAAEERIAALLRLNAANDDLHQADTAEVEAAKVLDHAKAKLREATAEEKACSCGAPSAFSLTLGERFVHRADGPCFIEQVHDSKFGKFEAADLGPYTEALKRAGVVAAAKEQARWIRSQERDAECKTAEGIEA